MIDIIPAIIPESVADLRERLSRVRGAVSSVQIDIVDGVFARPARFPMREKDEEEWRSLVRRDISLPYADEFYFEADMMVSHPENMVEDFVFAGFDRFVFHLKSAPPSALFEAIEKARLLDAEAGIALGVEDDVSLIDEWIDRIQFVQCMGIAHIGRQGEPFDPRVVGNVERLRERFSDIIISVDGGVNEKTIPFLAPAGARRFVAGSAVFGSDNPAHAIEILRRVAEAAESEG